MINTGIMTGLLGYSLKKEMLGDMLYYRETETFRYEIYSLDFTGFHPATVQTQIYNAFTGTYSGDINVKVFDVPAEFTLPNESIRANKYIAEIQVKSNPVHISYSQPELQQPYYAGLNDQFFINSGLALLDFREDFNFEVSNNGNQIFTHGLSFGLLTGNRNIAVGIASGIFYQDINTTFGVSTMVGQIANLASNNYQNYYSESYDFIRNTYSFTRKREVLPSGDIGYIFNLIHIINNNENGVFDITEKGNTIGKLSFSQAQNGAETLIAESYNRCNNIYSSYLVLQNTFSVNLNGNLINAPTKTRRMYNRYAMTADYEINYTDNPEMFIDETSKEELLDMDVSEIGIVSLKHNYNFAMNKRSATDTFYTLIQNAVSASPNVAANYYNNSSLFLPGLLLKTVKHNINWPNRKNKNASVTFEYSNNPRYSVTVGGITFNYLDYKVNIKEPADIINEYQVINKPNQKSLLNYAYQTKQGGVNVEFEAYLGKLPDEFATGFRSNQGPALQALYNYGVFLFFQQFQNQNPIAFTYYLADIKYSINQDGIVKMNMEFIYTIKKYTP